MMLCLAVPAGAQEKIRVVADEAKFEAVTEALRGDRNKAAKAADQRKRVMVERLRPAMNLELAFIRRATKLTDAQRKAIAADAENKLMDLAGQHNNILNGRVVLQVNGAFVQQQGNGQRGDMQATIRQAARDCTDKHLNEQQLAKLKREWEYRDQAEKTALIDDILSQLDSQLRLSQQQYDELQATFESKWQHAVSIRFNSGQVFTVPAVPEELVLPLLTDSQKAVWKLANKSHSYTYFNQSRNFFDEPLWENAEELKAEAEARAAAEAEATAKAVAKGGDAIKAQLEAAAAADAIKRAQQAKAAQEQEAAFELRIEQLEQAAAAVAAEKQEQANQ
ncbi:hypothetical protein [Roseimaritima ulvae]|uniref:hypothetical protein n=1 Tax=Roseimaritima ulvae TaxID=980254 RepID=UPI0011CD77A0|nr:hypothetical protein [Roseimaritima ulvae]